MPLYIALLVALGVAAAIWTVVAERRKKVSTDRRAETAVDRERRQHAKAEELRQPYRYADDNGLLVFGESVWGIYRMGGLTDDLYPSVLRGGAGIRPSAGRRAACVRPERQPSHRLPAHRHA